MYWKSICPALKGTDAIRWFYIDLFIENLGERNKWQRVSFLNNKEILYFADFCFHNEQFINICISVQNFLAHCPAPDQIFVIKYLKVRKYLLNIMVGQLLKEKGELWWFSDFLCFPHACFTCNRLFDLQLALCLGHWSYAYLKIFFFIFCN